MTNEICFLSAADLGAAYAAGKLSPVECIDAVLGRIERVNPELNAYFFVDADGAREAARQSEQRWLRGRPESPLDGVPVSIKDHILTAGMPSPWGIAPLKDIHDWPEDAPLTARLREAGAVLVGKTTQPEMAAFCSVVSGLYGIGRNPWDPALTPGGSSGGGAAALAAGLCAIAIGSDAGGSVRIPASYTGVYGFKPTFGRVPAYPPMGIGPVYGPMTRTVGDAALALNVITRPDWRDFYAAPYDPRNYHEGLDGDLDGLHAAYCPTFGFGLAAETEVAATVEAAVAGLESGGLRVTRVGPPFDFNLYDALYPAMAPGLAAMMGGLVGDAWDRVLPEVRAFVQGAEGITMAQFLQAKQVEMQACFTMAETFRDYDLILTPTMPTPAFDADRLFPPTVELNEFGYSFDHNPFTWPFNLTLQPAASIPCGTTKAGLPIGLQIAGLRYDDFGVLKASRAWEARYSNRPPWPLP